MTNPNVAKGLRKLFQRRASFVLVGLTGRTGSGCSTATSILSQQFAELKLPAPKTEDFSAEDRKYRIARNYAEKNWTPFFGISVSNVILSFLLDAQRSDLEIFLKASGEFNKPGQLESFLSEWKTAVGAWGETSHVLHSPSTNFEEQSKFISVWQEQLSQFFATVKKGLGTTSVKLLQLVGDNLRKSGNPLSDSANPDNFYVLPERVAALANVIRKVQEHKHTPAYVVVDALRNPFEILYFRERFSSFYLIAITTEDADRAHRLAHLGYSPAQISEYDKKEYPEKNKPLSGYDAFTSQNIQSCLEKADIYIRNNGSATQQQEPNLNDFTSQLVRYFALMIHPGLVTPTRMERCMQIAFSARANSGCISRQVGAAITDKNDSIKAVGWNDVPAGQVPCLLRRATDLISKVDEEAFSAYEYNDKGFRKRVDGSYKRFALVDMGGRPSSFCFRTEYNALKSQDNQVHTRSLHAEENAFLQLAKYSSGGIEGGRLYTTASPCELCAKKAFQLGIQHIFYIDPYPGISLDHVLTSGAKNLRPMVQLYQGAVGQAYHKLYDPILPYKDEVTALMENDSTLNPVDSIPKSSDSSQLF
jgi:deoxycytidylate deaminase